LGVRVREGVRVSVSVGVEVRVGGWQVVDPPTGGVLFSVITNVPNKPLPLIVTLCPRLSLKVSLLTRCPLAVIVHVSGVGMFSPSLWMMKVAFPLLPQLAVTRRVRAGVRVKVGEVVAVLVGTLTVRASTHAGKLNICGAPSAKNPFTWIWSGHTKYTRTPRP
jgi:hypothetical protein